MTHPSIARLTFLFTDIEGSTRLWEQHLKAAVLDGGEQRYYHGFGTRLRDALGDATFETAYDEGTALSRDKAVKLSLKTVRTADPTTDGD